MFITSYQVESLYFNAVVVSHNETKKKKLSFYICKIILFTKVQQTLYLFDPSFQIYSYQTKPRLTTTIMWR